MSHVEVKVYHAIEYAEEGVRKSATPETPGPIKMLLSTAEELAALGAVSIIPPSVEAKALVKVAR